VVPSSASAAQESSRVSSRCLARGLAGLLTLLLIAPAAHATDDVEWKRAFIVGSIGRKPASDEDLVARGADRVRLHVVLEGESGELPVYCSPFAKLRVDGRSLAGRLVQSVADCGLQDAHVQWVSVDPERDLSDWRRTRVRPDESRWSFALDQDREARAPDTTGIAPIYGTRRWAAAVTLPDGRVIGTDGFRKRRDWLNPDYAPGYAVTREHGETLAGKAIGFARLPVLPRATIAHARAKTAYRSCDLAFAAYEDLAGMALPGDWDAGLASEEWSWLFELVEPDVRRRETPGAFCVGSRGRGLHWARGVNRQPEGLRKGDVLILDGQCVLLEHDDGDGWLGNGDRVLHTVTGVLARGDLQAVPGRRATIVRPRAFRNLRRQLEEAGYGALGNSVYFEGDLQRALREFQRDQGLPVSGLPGPDTLDRLEKFTISLREAGAGAE
jgi:hypothetical protein